MVRPRPWSLRSTPRSASLVLLSSSAPPQPASSSSNRLSERDRRLPHGAGKVPERGHDQTQRQGAGQSSRTRPRIDLIFERLRLPSTRRRWDPLVGLVGTRLSGGGASASRSRSASRKRAATRLRCCERCSDAVTVSFGPSWPIARARCASLEGGGRGQVETDLHPAVGRVHRLAARPGGLREALLEVALRDAQAVGDARTRAESEAVVTACATRWPGRCPSPSALPPPRCVRTPPRR